MTCHVLGPIYTSLPNDMHSVGFWRLVKFSLFGITLSIVALLSSFMLHNALASFSAFALYFSLAVSFKSAFSDGVLCVILLLTL